MFDVISAAERPLATVMPETNSNDFTATVADTLTNEASWTV